MKYVIFKDGFPMVCRKTGYGRIIKQAMTIDRATLFNRPADARTVIQNKPGALSGAVIFRVETEYAIKGMVQEGETK